MWMGSILLIRECYPFISLRIDCRKNLLNLIWFYSYLFFKRVYIMTSFGAQSEIFEIQQYSAFHKNSAISSPQTGNWIWIVRMIWFFPIHFAFFNPCLHNIGIDTTTKCPESHFQFMPSPIAVLYWCTIGLADVDYFRWQCFVWK